MTNYYSIPVKKALLFPALLIVFHACNNETEKSKTVQPGQTAAHSDSLKREMDVPALSTEVYISALINRREAIKQQLTGISGPAAVQLYNSLVLYMDTVLTAVTRNEQSWLGEYVNYYNEKEKKIIPPPAVQARINLLATAALEPWPIGEGMTDLRAVPRFYTDLFQSSLPPDYKQFLQLHADEDTILYSADAGIIIPIENVGKRVLNWEKFLHTFPNSLFYAEAVALYKRYLRDYMIGEDNTPSFHNENDINSLAPENRQEYISFLEKNGNTTTAGIVRMFLEELAAERSVKELIRKTSTAIDLLFSQEILSAPVDKLIRTDEIESLTKSVYDTISQQVEIDRDITEKISRVLDTVLYVQQDNNLYSIAVFASRGESGAAPVSGWCDVWTFKYANGHWQTLGYQLHAGGGGMYGNPGYFHKLVRMADNVTGIVIGGGITHMGSSLSWDDIIPFSNEQLLKPYTNGGYDIPAKFTDRGI